jgi:uncharacterized protein (UPF0332 family)
MNEPTRPIPPSGIEIERLLAVAERDLNQAQLSALHSDTRFALAYNAGLQLSTVILRLRGIRVRSAGFHQQTFIALSKFLDEERQMIAGYFDRARRKRNTAAYEQIGVVSEGEVIDLIEQVSQFREWVIQEVENQ